ncbi:MAG: hypothetical protein EB059_03200 [Alphaproteobacteria bacterium]|nr:hypothetical protein [Alphaproteobacteria bacterium]
MRKGQQEGEFQNRRNAPVSEQDRLFLEGYGLQWETLVDGSPWIIIYNFPLPSGYNHAHVTVAIRLEQGYPLTGLDMMYVFPALIRLDGKPIVQTETLQMIDGRQFQRWSRHRTGDNPWIPGQDSLETHIYLVEEFFQAEFVH